MISRQKMVNTSEECEQTSQSAMSKHMFSFLFHVLLTTQSPRDVLRKLFAKRRLTLSQHQFDTFGKLFVSPQVAISLGLIPNELVQLTVTYTLPSGATQRVDRIFTLRISPNNIGNRVVIGRFDAFNLLGRTSATDITVESIIAVRFLPKLQKSIAKPNSARVVRIKSYGVKEVNASDLLFNFVKQPRIIYSGDYFCIRNNDVLNECNEMLCYKFECTSSPCYLDTSVTLYESSVSTTAVVVPFAGRQQLVALPSNLSNLVDRMTQVMTAYEDVEESTLVVSLCGVAGSGKSLVVNEVASRTHRNVIETNCFELTSEVSGQVEAKLKNLFEKAATYTPCILHLKCADVLGLDAVTNSIDSRVIAVLRRLLDSSHSISLVFSSENEQSISKQLRSLCLYTFSIEHMNEAHRIEFFQSMQLQPELVRFAARHSSGFVLSELFDLIRDAKFRATAESSQINELNEKNIEWAIEKRNESFADAIGAPKIPTVSWDDVGGLEETKRLVIESIESNLHASRALRRSGLILFGPPGCGKTLIAKAVATEFKVAFLSVKGPELLNKYVGQSEENVRKVFERARQASPCVIFFDELDSLAPNRGRNGDSGGVMDRIVSQLLSELDSLHSDASSKVFVIAATNRADLLDPSLLTPGRFDNVVNVKVGSDPQSKCNILTAVSRKLRLDDDVDLLKVAEDCPKSMSGAELYSLVSSATMDCLREQIAHIENGDISVNDANVTVSQRHFNASLRSLLSNA